MEGPKNDGNISSTSLGSISPNGKQGFRRELRSTLLCQLPPHPGTSLFCPPEGMQLGGARTQQPQGQDSSYSPKGLKKGDAGGGEGGVCCVSAAGSNW